MKKYRRYFFVCLMLNFFIIISLVGTNFAVQDFKGAVQEPAQEKIIFSFEEDILGWNIPEWAQKKNDYVAEQTSISRDYVSEGKGSLEVKADFPGEKWTAAYVEYEEYFDWTDYSNVAVDIYIPKGTPVGLMGKIIFVVGDDWKWTEMIQPARLVPGEWITIRANLIPGSTDWRGVKPDEGFRKGIRKFGVRIESDKKPVYKGSFYIDNVRLTVLPADKLKKEVKEPTEETIIFSFEKDIQGWDIPEWAREKDDHVAKETCMSREYSSDGEGSLEVKADFPGKKWTAAYLEYGEYFDWTEAREVALDIYIPRDAPSGLMGKIVLIVGDDWEWTEMRHPVPLVSGKWTTIKANLMPGSIDWRGLKPDDEFRMDVRKLGIRVDSDKKPVYKGSFYVDNIRLAVLPSGKIKEEKEPAEEEVIFGFEESVKGWEVPDWAKEEKKRYVVKEIDMSGKCAAEGKSSLEVKADFPGKKWTAAYVEYEEYCDWTNYSEVAVDIYIPKDAPIGLKGKIILVVGEDWEWAEMIHPVPLVSGKWTTIRANLMPGSIDWRGLKPDDGFRTDLKKLGIRVESDKKPVYKGSFYVDNIRLAVLPSDKIKEEKEPAEEEVIFGFEESVKGWEVPDWAKEEKKRYVVKEIDMSGKCAAEGKSSLEVKADFPGKKWTAAYVEYEQYFNWTNARDIAIDIYIPKDAPIGLKGKIILVVGKDWKWTEMKYPVRLIPGKWTTIRANLMPGSTGWKGLKPDDEFRMDVRKLGIRVDSDKKPVYKGSFYVDNIRLAVLPSGKIKEEKEPAEENVIFGFEEEIESWKVPDWAWGRKGYVAKEICISRKFAAEGERSLEVKADFSGKKWTAAYVENIEYLDFSDGREVAVDIYLPEDAPSGLMGKIILAVGEEWKWTEMIHPVRLVPGKWTTIRANLMPGSIDWQGLKPDEGFRMGIRKLGIRVESDKKPVYKGSFYIDNIRLAVLKK